MPHSEPVLEIQTGDGHRFELVDIAPQAPKRTLLLLPGMGISARHYIGLARLLAESGTRVLIHEWRGNGSSSRRAGKRHRQGDWGYRELIECDLAAAQQTAVEHNRGRPVWLGGHSLGAQLAALAAARKPADSAGLVLIAGGTPAIRAFPRPLRWLLVALFVTAPPLSRFLGHFPGRALKFAGTEAHGVMRDWAQTGRTGRYDLETLDFPAEAALERLALPVLTVRMAEDAFVPVASLRRLTAKLPGCSIEDQVVSSEEQGARADHFRWLSDPGPTARRIANWLDQAPVDPPG